MKALNKLKTQYTLLKQREENGRKEYEKQQKVDFEKIKELEMDISKKEIKIEHLSERVEKLDESNRQTETELKK